MPGDESGVEASAFHVAGQPACTGLHDLADLRPRRLQGGKEAEDDSDEQCQAYAEEQDAEIDVEVGFIGVGVVGEARNEEPDGLEGDNDAQPRSGDG